MLCEKTVRTFLSRCSITNGNIAAGEFGLGQSWVAEISAWIPKDVTLVYCGNDPLYPFGYGLSYTPACLSSRVRPVKALKGFWKISLAPGKTNGPANRDSSRSCWARTAV